MTKTTPTKERLNQRLNVMVTLLVVAFIACIGQLVRIQVFEAPRLAEEALVIRTRASEITPRRGSILDAHGKVLAESVQTYHIAVNQDNIRSYVHVETYTDEAGVERLRVAGRGPAEAARQLAPLLGIDEIELGGMMLGDSSYRYLKKNVDAVTYRKIRALDIFGIEWETVFNRTHPNGNTAAPILGTINGENVGASGLEARFDADLQGQSGQEAYEIAPNGAIIPGGKRVKVEPVEGTTLKTTLVSDLQHLVQDRLDARTQQHQAQWGAIVVLDVATGRVLAMADSNSTVPDNAKPQAVAAVQYAYEPGSVGKVITIATALEKGKVTPTSAFTVADRIEPADAGGPITDYHEHPTTNMTTTGILTESSNVGTVAVGETVTDHDRYELMKKFGFGELTGIELGGESPGVIRPDDQWQGRDRYTTMFGQAYSINVLQEASLMATIANGGVRIPPRIIDSFIAADQTVEVPQQPEPVQVLSPETAKNLVTMMESVVAEKTGTGQTARVDGYRLAVKTGTADIFVDGQPAVVSTTAGIVPADNPRLAIAVVLYNPKVVFLSSDSSAPLFGEVTTDAVRALSIPASSGPAHLFPQAP